MFVPAPALKQSRKFGKKMAGKKMGDDQFAMR